MKKYIYEYLINLPNEKKNEQIKKYIEYLKEEIQRAKFWKMIIILKLIICFLYFQKDLKFILIMKILNVFIIIMKKGKIQF